MMLKVLVLAFYLAFANASSTRLIQPSEIRQGMYWDSARFLFCPRWCLWTKKLLGRWLGKFVDILLFVVKTKIESTRHAWLTEMWAALAGKYQQSSGKAEIKKTLGKSGKGDRTAVSRLGWASPCARSSKRKKFQEKRKSKLTSTVVWQWGRSWALDSCTVAHPS